MGKTLKENFINNPKDGRELENIYLFELLNELKDNIKEEDILIFFERYYDYKLNKKQRLKLYDNIKMKLEKILIKETKQLKQAGHISVEEMLHRR